MRIAILGPGRIGSTLAGLLAEAGHAVMLSAYRDEDAAWRLADSLGVNIGNLDQAAEFGQVFMLSVPHREAAATMRALGSAHGVLVDCTNQFGGRTSTANSTSEVLAQISPKLLVVKAFNTLRFDVLRGRAHEDPPLAMVYAGDSAAATSVVDTLIQDCGFAPLNLGPLSNGLMQEPGGPFFLEVLTLDAAIRMATGFEQTAGYMPSAPID